MMVLSLKGTGLVKDALRYSERCSKFIGDEITWRGRS